MKLKWISEYNLNFWIILPMGDNFIRAWIHYDLIDPHAKRHLNLTIARKFGTAGGVNIQNIIKQIRYYKRKGDIKELKAFMETNLKEAHPVYFSKIGKLALK